MNAQMRYALKCKNTDITSNHDFCWSGKPINHLQKQGIYFKTNNKIPINLLK